ncbi:MFS transporter [Pandoraea fibrosis]|uniref:MFS transporter n=1 Tax=Pandoraea fibrosis TaxID=1891094 RepID=A0ABX6HSJ4_9BURK|nr:MFS transporter [Pandoraea fibrosis]QHE93226.1 MFS transporter [Pandoraea fibrosis]QHF13215.1 MFS transporter [Pandoraea fibrosis]
MDKRWKVLWVLCLCVFQFTLNWFCVVPAFPSIAREWGLSIPAVAGLIAAFVGGYGVFHLPAGWLSAHIGMRRALFVGIAIEALGTMASASTDSYATAIALRAVAGAGGACCLGAAVGLVSAWFRERELSLAIGMTTGVAFAVGAATGLFLWSYVIGAFGWRVAFVASGLVGLAVLVVAAVSSLEPPSEGASTAGHHLSLDSIKRVLVSRPMWLWGASIIGSYGAFFTTAQFLPIYVEHALRLTPAEGGRISAILLLSGIPAALFGGWITDRFGKIRALICGAFVLSGLVMIALPLFSADEMHFAALAIGLVTMIGLTPWFSLPAMYRDSIALPDVPAASGLMLSIAAVGGFLVPLGFGFIVSHYGFGLGWQFLGAVSIVFTAFGLIAPVPHRTASTSAMQQSGAL